MNVFAGFLLCLVAISSAQAYYFPGGGAEGQTRYIYSDTAYVRASASEQAAVTDKLSVGDEVTVLAQTDQQSTSNNLDDSWLKITYQHQGVGKEGYVWEGNLSFTQLRRGDVKFVYGVEGFDGKEGIYSAKIKAVKDGTVISQQSFSPTHASMIEGRIIAAAHLSGVEQVIAVTYSGTACGLGYADYYFAWTGSELIYLLKGFEVGEETYNDGASIIFPPASSMDDIVIKLIKSGHSEDEDTPMQWQIKTEVYQWRKDRLELKNQHWSIP